jgi:hypothetical protein
MRGCRFPQVLTPPPLEKGIIGMLQGLKVELNPVASVEEGKCLMRL